MPFLILIMQINPHILRSYDVRGVVNKDLNPEIVKHFGRAYGTYIAKRGAKLVVVGRDSRLTSEEYSRCLIAGIVSTGLDVIDIGLNLVGTVYWAQYYLNVVGAAMVTASHNPVEYNGFKFANGFSEAMVTEQQQELKDIMETETYLKAITPGRVTQKDIRQIYYDDLIKRFNIQKKFKVVVDASCATPGVIIPELLRQVGCEVIELNCILDGTFPVGTPDPTEQAISRRLAKKVLEAQADIGFSYDADGDRIGIVDEKGTIIWNDILVALFAMDVLNYHPGATIMYNTLCSQIVDWAIKKAGGTPFMWRTGHGFLKNKNREVKAAFIGELSGHFFFSADFYNHDDGCYTTLRLLDYLSRTNQTLNQAISTFPYYISSPEIKIGCADELKAGLIAKMSTKLKADFPQAQIIDDERAGDGVRLDNPDSMLVIRYSQNGPYLTIKMEAKVEAKYNELKKYIYNLLRQYPEIDWAFGVNIASLQ